MTLDHDNGDLSGVVLEDPLSTGCWKNWIANNSTS